MSRKGLRVAAVPALVVALGVAAACGQWTPPAPTSPSEFESPSSGTTITGLLKQKGGSALTAATIGGPDAAASIKVSVVGTNVSSNVDGTGRFVLAGAFSGNVQLRVTGPGVDAALTVTSVDNRELVDLQVEVEGTIARLEASVRIKADNTTEVEGDVTRVSGTCPNLNVVVHGYTLNLSSSTQGSCADVRVGIRIKIRGNRSGNVIIVVKIESRRVNDHDDDDDHDDHDDDDD